jgi:hypothetical protein
MGWRTPGPECKGASMSDSPAGTPADLPATFTFDARRWTWGEAVTGCAALILLVSLLMPWFGLRFHHSLVSEYAGIRFWPLWFVLILDLAILAALVLRAGFGRVPFVQWPSDRQLLAGAAWLIFLTVTLTFVLVKPVVTGLHASHIPPGFVAVDKMLGAFLGLAAAVAVMLAASINLFTARSGPEPARHPRPG